MYDNSNAIKFEISSLWDVVWKLPGGYSQKNCARVCGPLPKTLILFMTKICDFPYPIYDLTKTFDTLFMT